MLTDVGSRRFGPPAHLPRRKQITHTSVQMDGGLSNPLNAMNAPELYIVGLIFGIVGLGVQLLGELETENV
jgi:hypothetical protein